MSEKIQITGKIEEGIRIHADLPVHLRSSIHPASSQFLVLTVNQTRLLLAWLKQDEHESVFR